MNDLRLAICVMGSVLLHFALSRGLDELPRITRPTKIEVAIVEPPPPPPPPPEPEKPPEPQPEPKPVPHDAPKPHRVQAAAVAPVPKDTPPPVNAAVTTDPDATPVFGVTMESTSTGGGPAMPVGNTTRAAPDTGSAAPAAKPLPEPVGAFEATKMPIPEGRCTGKYTDDARAAGVEGTVVLDLIVGEDGRVREVQVVSKLGHGLDEAAVAALRACRFSPGEKDGKPVPVRIRGFKIQFVLQEAN